MMPNERRWYAVYTRPRFEKKSHEMLGRRGIQAFLPLRKSLRIWSDRKKMVEEPIIRSYVFVNIGSSDYYEVLNTYGVARFVQFEGTPAPIPDNQIELLKYICGDEKAFIEPTPSLLPGTRVRITGGPFVNHCGSMIRTEDTQRVAIEIDHLKQSILLHVDPIWLTVLPN
jgi:transcriptional antiterminator RfaH